MESYAGFYAIIFVVCLILFWLFMVNKAKALVMALFWPVSLLYLILREAIKK